MYISKHLGTSIIREETRAWIPKFRKSVSYIYYYPADNNGNSRQQMGLDHDIEGISSAIEPMVTWKNAMTVLVLDVANPLNEDDIKMFDEDNHSIEFKTISGKIYKRAIREVLFKGRHTIEVRGIKVEVTGHQKHGTYRNVVY